MDGQGAVVISDFGVAGWVTTQAGDRAGGRGTFVGTPCWMAPEVMEQRETYDEKADIWSVGITALELAKGYAPYARLSPLAIIIQTIREEPPSLKTYKKMEQESGQPQPTSSRQSFSKAFRDLVALCLNKNRKLRPTAATLLSKNFISNAKSNEVLQKDLLLAVPIPDVTEIKVKEPDEPNPAAAGGKSIARTDSGTNTSIEAGSQPRIGAVQNLIRESRHEPGTTWDFGEYAEPQQSTKIDAMSDDSNSNFGEELLEAGISQEPKGSK
eukprot:snap_masked-scaffold_1-processed-gene-20.27-mRNA-1 protein AED:0.03 eAED:0.03 QI:785/1/1/1/0.5/0.4/5/381/268